ncbi:hypothetical protein [Acinetobacter sp.]|uniref:hypothetical protein n=1 Tax=Acinetobacter sp. TaxID=472 RepID=UPI00388F8AC7
MNHRIVLIVGMTLASMLLSSCDEHDDSKAHKNAAGIPDAEEIEVNFPAEMMGCKVYRVHGKAFQMMVTHCPNATTTTQYGKYGKSIVENPNPDPDFECETSAEEREEK